MNCKPEVKILADSISPDGVRLTTFQLRYWRPIHSEIMTHRVFSRNAKSSRATPTAILTENVKKDCWGPAHWGINQKGMSAKTELNSMEKIQAEMLWETFARGTGQFAELCANTGINLHKQIINRILEPYTYIDVVLSSTDFKNFFKLREDEHAQPEMQDLARTMHRCLDENVPTALKEGEWHLPYITLTEKELADTETLKKVSAARCARVSYKAFDGTTSIEADIELANKLIENKHMSAFEHIATPASDKDYMRSNFRGWNQYRKYIPDEAVAE